MKEFQSGKIKLINCDCIDFMRELPDHAFDLAIVDPPYGCVDNEPDSNRGGCEGTFIRRDMGDKVQTNHAFGGRFRRYGFSIAQWDIAPGEEYFRELFRVSRNQIIWGANYFPNMPPTRCFVIWRKLTISDRFTMAMAEYAWTSFNGNAKVFEYAPQGKRSDPRFHPTQKPVALYGWLMNKFAKEGDMILDTHLGSGSSAIAANALGFDFVGCEIAPDYYERAKERLIRDQAQLKLVF